MRKVAFLGIAALVALALVQKASPEMVGESVRSGLVNVASPTPTTTVAPSPSPTASLTPAPSQEIWVDIYPHARWNGRDPVNFLILGSDGRRYHPARCFIDRSRADAIHLVSVNPVTGAGTVLNIPRDSYVSIPGYGRQKINAAMFYGGAPLMVRTVENLTGIDVHYYAVTTFCGLIKMVNAVGGMTVRVPYDIQDAYAGFGLKGECRAPKILKKGLRRLDGCEVLYFARSRHAVPGGDFGRTTNQGRILIAGLKRFKELARTPAGMLTGLKAIRQHVRMNITCSLSDLVNATGCVQFLKLANLARSVVHPADFGNFTLKGSSGWAGSMSVVYLDSTNNDRGDAIFRDIKSDAVINGR